MKYNALLFILPPLYYFDCSIAFFLSRIFYALIGSAQLTPTANKSTGHFSLVWNRCS
jgi:hypothetical protein